MKLLNIKKFFNEVKIEVNKVTWPSRKELTSSTAMVLVVIFITAAVFSLIDYTVHALVNLLLNIGI